MSKISTFEGLGIPSWKGGSHLNKAHRQNLISAAMDGEATLAIKNAKVVNVFTEEIIEADVGIYGDTIIGVGSYSAVTEVDAKGAYLCPGLIDSHVHIESSMVTPSLFAKTVLPRGTTSVIADPHEIANVCGALGIKTMLVLSEGLPLNVFIMLSSCVPATPFENSGYTLTAADFAPFIRNSRVLGLGEVMDYVSVTEGEDSMMDKLELFENLPIDGHAPLLSGHALNAYRAAGPMTDHECSCFGEFLEKLRTGMYMQIRVGSAASGIEDMLKGIVDHGLPTDSMFFCTDDKHLENIRREGHIDHIIRLAVRAGIPPVRAVRMATLNAARVYGLKKLGAVAPGYRADLILVDDLADFKVRKVITGGKIYRELSPQEVPLSPSVLSSINIKPMGEDPFRLHVSSDMPVIKVIPGQLVNELKYREVPSESCIFTPDRTYSKLAVIERHHALGTIGLGIVEGFGLQNGAIASTVAHDSHNMVVLGDNDRDMRTAVDSLAECGGGFAVVSGGIVLSRLPLSIAGLMSDAPVETILEKQRALLDAAYSLGVDKRIDPLISLTFLALPVIPEVRLTDKGLFNVALSKFIYMGNNEHFI
jgi:adenine deaminase